MTAFDRLKKLCDSQGISVNKLEEKIGLSKNTLYSWKKNTPKGSNLIKVSDYFDVSTDYLLGRTDKKRIDEIKNDPYKVIAAHIDDDVTDKELEDIKNFIEFVKSKRK
ncbi:transcriptional regulator with XRE-family HTH domain [Cytobacillus firmus]|uniref:Transcriptional regulator with XRE-family HTH domain n=2 Tax=Cytobacillus TaxID=2675230 RepID=A0A366JN76_CYTFI|nr:MULTISPECIES: helix-turn-helix transcriptional regulator [Cytobacillus]RBP89354.1 transcriptional regulator with XRE-family HTH domain [Cytobacillus firmus]TDX47419.1 transcriptional regulator with XRE-family HTH domain [Cytobacillus oceanisediminis]